MSFKNSKKILVAPLDWGLGHTTRCVPLIRYLLASGHQPVVAGNETQLAFLQSVFPGIPGHFLEGYNVHYASSGNRFMLTLAGQLPRIRNVIRREHQWLRKLVDEENMDAVLSDNRYGLYHPHIPSVIMTHQLQPLSGMGALADRAVLRLHLHALKHFSECWIPDMTGGFNLSGRLGHPEAGIPDRDIKYIGLLTQFEDVPADAIKENHLLVLLSGPEPQRSILSDILWQQLQHYEGPVVFVEGSNAAVPRVSVPAHIRYYLRLTTQELLPQLAGAVMVICRSGYSSLMDLQRLGKKAILVPTPGQTEQEYLAGALYEKGVYMMRRQNQVKLEEAIAEAGDFPFRRLASPADFSVYKNILGAWLNTY